MGDCLVQLISSAMSFVCPAVVDPGRLLDGDGLGWVWGGINPHGRVSPPSTTTTSTMFGAGWGGGGAARVVGVGWGANLIKAS